MVVQDELSKLGLHYTSVELGYADVEEDISRAQRDQIRANLLKSGLELMDDVRADLVENIKIVVIELVHYSEEPLSVNFSIYLSQELHHDYAVPDVGSFNEPAYNPPFASAVWASPDASGLQPYKKA